MIKTLYTNTEEAWMERGAVVCPYVCFWWLTSYIIIYIIFFWTHNNKVIINIKYEKPIN